MMKKVKICLNWKILTCLFVCILLLSGCGKKENDSPNITENDSNTDIPVETEEETIEIENTLETVVETDVEMEAGNVLKLDFEGDGSVELNGKISSIIIADTDLIIASTSNGRLFLLEPFIDFYFPEDAKIKYSEITDGCNLDSLAYASQHLAYGPNKLVYFEVYGEYADDDIYMLDSFELPEYTYMVENVKQIELAESQSLLLVRDEAKLIVYADNAGHACAYRDDKVYSDVGFSVNGMEKENVSIRKGIYQFVLTDNQELLYINNINITENFDGTISEILLSCEDLTGGINSKIADVYNCQNYEDACYVVDENNNIYYVEDSWLEDDITVELITQFENGNITDIQGFAGTYEDILIGTDDGSYYYHNDYSGTLEIEALNKAYKNVVLLMDGNLLALGNDGFLYGVENPMP